MFKRASFGNMDIDALVYLVLMEATQEMDNDLKTMTAEMKEKQEQKKQMRESLARKEGTIEPKPTSTPASGDWSRSPRPSATSIP